MDIAKEFADRLYMQIKDLPPEEVSDILKTHDMLLKFLDECYSHGIELKSVIITLKTFIELVKVMELEKLR